MKYIDVAGLIFQF